MVQEILQLLVQMDCISYCASSYQRIYLGIAWGWRCLRILGYSVWFSLNAFFLPSCQTAPLLGQMLWLRVCSLSLVCPHFGVGVQRLSATLLSVWSESSFWGCALPHPPSSWETHGWRLWTWRLWGSVGNAASVSAQFGTRSAQINCLLHRLRAAYSSP